MERKYIDVNVFVYWLSGEGELHKRAKKWIKKLEQSTRGEFCTSILSLYETAVIIAGLTGRTLKDRKYIIDLYKVFSDLKKLKLIPLNQKILVEAINAMKEKDLDLEDAIHYASAKECKAAKIITNDKDFNKTDIPSIF